MVRADAEGAEAARGGNRDGEGRRAEGGAGTGPPGARRTESTAEDFNRVLEVVHKRKRGGEAVEGRDGGRASGAAPAAPGSGGAAGMRAGVASPARAMRGPGRRTSLGGTGGAWEPWQGVAGDGGHGRRISGAAPAPEEARPPDAQSRPVQVIDCRGADPAQDGGLARAAAPVSPVGGEPSSPAWDHGAVGYHEDEGSPTYRMWTSEDEDGGPRGAQDENGHPGYARLIDGVTPASLRERWASTAADAGTRTLAFYSEKEGNPEPWLSNFYTHAPFVFVLPFDAGPGF